MSRDRSRSSGPSAVAPAAKRPSPARRAAAGGGPSSSREIARSVADRARSTAGGARSVASGDRSTASSAQPKRPKSATPSATVNPTEEPSEYQSYYAIVRQIPAASVLTYGDVAALAGRPRSARRVGYALSALKDPSVPWWRVVNARGQISPRSGDLLGACELDQRARLLQEGVALDAEGRIDLSRYRLSALPTRRPSSINRRTRRADA